jgi:hypothetical protein
MAAAVAADYLDDKQCCDSSKAFKSVLLCHWHKKVLDHVKNFGCFFHSLPFILTSSICLDESVIVIFHSYQSRNKVQIQNISGDKFSWPCMQKAVH